MISRKNWLKWALFVVILMNYFSVLGQIVEKSLGFEAPLAIPLSLSGTFGELRSNHFHSGIDIRTDGRQGIPVLATSDGHISRIKISSTGFGKVIYIDHQVGYTSVYGHLYCFANPIDCLMDSVQRVHQNFEVEIFPDSLRFPVHKGDVIGWSGSSGGSEAPHLHFEIRDRITEEPMNPLLFGFDIKDTNAPVLRNFLFYGYKDSIWSVKTNRNFKMTGNNDEIIYLDTDTAGIGFEAMDLDSTSLLGIYSAELICNDSLIYKYAYNRFNFNESRYINAHIDYDWNFRLKSKVERCFKLVGDSCSFFKDAGKGFILLNDSSPIRIKLTVKDFIGNEVNSEFLMQRKKNENKIAFLDTNKIYFNKPFTFISKDLAISIPSGALYQNDNWNFSSKKSKNKKMISDIYQIMDGGTPFHKSVIIKKKFKTTLNGKIVFVELTDEQEIKNTFTCKEDKDFLVASIRSGGSFGYTVDTVAPFVKEIFYQADPVSGNSILAVKIIEALSGLKSYACFVNDTWTLSEWDPRTNSISIFPENQSYGPNKLVVKLVDGCGNEGRFDGIY